METDILGPATDARPTAVRKEWTDQEFRADVARSESNLRAAAEAAREEHRSGRTEPFPAP